MLIQGVVERVQEYPSKYQDKGGKPKPSVWAMVVDNTRYSLGTVKPPAQGTSVRFEATQDAKGYWNADGSTLTTAAPQAQAYAAVASKVPTVSVTDLRQDSIIYQSSRKDSLEFVNMLLANGLIDFGKAKGAQKIEMVEIFLDNYTTRFFDDCKRLAPPEHNSPVDAEPIAAAQALAKPARKTKPVEATEDFEDDLPF